MAGLDTDTSQYESDDYKLSPEDTKLVAEELKFAQEGSNNGTTETLDSAYLAVAFREAFLGQLPPDEKDDILQGAAVNNQLLD